MNTIVHAAFQEAKRIREPGKFEGEPDWVPAFWDAVLEGSEDFSCYGPDGVLYAAVNVTAEDLKDWPSLKDIHSVVIWEDDQGFVRSGLVSRGYNECWFCGEIVVDTFICDDCESGGDE